MKRFLVGCSIIFTACANAGLLVTDVAGKAEIDGKGSVATLSEIPDGAQLTLSPGAQVTAVDLTSGREYVLKPGKYAVSSSGLKTAEGKAVDAKPLPAKNLPDVKVAPGKLAQATLVMRSLRKFNVPVLHSPARTTVISTRPTFKWGGVEGAASYRLILKDRDGNPVWDAAVAETEVATDTKHTLTPGENYTWRIEALGTDERTISDASANFSVASADTITRMTELRPAANAPFGRRVLYAAQLNEAGAVSEAREIWKTLAHERPDDAVLKSLAE